MRKEYTCIVCPLGCSLVLEEQNGSIFVTGNKCNRGEVYAKEEFSSPKRVVTATCKSNNKLRIPVKSDKPVPKENIFELLGAIYSLKANIPINTGDIVIANYKNLGINIVASRSFK
ncbi:MAG TPA: DUF1667 domain-containing protein [Spirochaetota bacterium]|nr:DUF1667 domain-containing protein [Spirochaetota bacterium]